MSLFFSIVFRAFASLKARVADSLAMKVVYMARMVSSMTHKSLSETLAGARHYFHEEFAGERTRDADKVSITRISRL